MDLQPFTTRLQHSWWQLKMCSFIDFIAFHFPPLWKKIVCLHNELAPFKLTNVIFLFWLPLSCDLTYSWVNKHNILTTTNIFSCPNRETLKRGWDWAKWKERQNNIVAEGTGSEVNELKFHLWDLFIKLLCTLVSFLWHRLMTGQNKSS